MHESSPGYGPGCGPGCGPASLRSILDRSRISHGLNMDEPGMYSRMTWKQVALAGQEPNESCQPMIMIPLETCHTSTWVTCVNDWSAASLIDPNDVKSSLPMFCNNSLMVCVALGCIWRPQG